MQDTNRQEAPWMSSAYLLIENVIPRKRDLVVRFQDGAEVEVELKCLKSPHTGRINWARTIFSPYEIAAPSTMEIVIIPSTRIRELTDESYAAHLERATLKWKTNIGPRLRALRELRGRTSKDVAQEAGISAVSLSRIENGRHGVRLQTVERILQVLGCSVEDLVFNNMSYCDTLELPIVQAPVNA